MFVEIEVCLYINLDMVQRIQETILSSQYQIDVYLSDGFSHTLCDQNAVRFADIFSKYNRNKAANLGITDVKHPDRAVHIKSCIPADKSELISI